MAHLSPETLDAQSDEVFADKIRRMSTEELMSVVSELQEDMGQEQQRFNLLSQRLARLDSSDPVAHHELNTELMESQTRLTHLMSRNMQCFSQQTENENRALREGSSADSTTTPLLTTTAIGENLLASSPGIGLEEASNSEQELNNSTNSNTEGLVNASNNNICHTGNLIDVTNSNSYCAENNNATTNITEPGINGITDNMSQREPALTNITTEPASSCQTLPATVIDNHGTDRDSSSYPLNHQKDIKSGSDHQVTLESAGVISHQVSPHINGVTPETMNGHCGVSLDAELSDSISSQSHTQSFPNGAGDTEVINILPVSVTRALYQKNTTETTNTSSTKSPAQTAQKYATNVASQPISIEQSFTSQPIENAKTSTISHAISVNGTSNVSQPINGNDTSTDSQPTKFKDSSAGNHPISGADSSSSISSGQDDVDNVCVKPSSLVKKKPIGIAPWHTTNKTSTFSKPVVNETKYIEDNGKLPDPQPNKTFIVLSTAQPNQTNNKTSSDKPSDSHSKPLGNQPDLVKTTMSINQPTQVNTKPSSSGQPTKGKQPIVYQAKVRAAKTEPIVPVIVKPSVPSTEGDTPPSWQVKLKSSRSVPSVTQNASQNGPRDPVSAGDPVTVKPSEVKVTAPIIRQIKVKTTSQGEGVKKNGVPYKAGNDIKVTAVTPTTDPSNNGSDPWQVKLRTTKSVPSLNENVLADKQADDDIVTTVTTETKTVTMRKQTPAQQSAFSVRSGTSRPVSCSEPHAYEPGVEEELRPLAKVFRESRSFFENAAVSDNNNDQDHLKTRSVSMMNLPPKRDPKVVITATSSQVTSQSEGKVKDVKRVTAQVETSSDQQGSLQNVTDSSHRDPLQKNHVSTRIAKVSPQTTSDDVMSVEKLQSIRGTGEMTDGEVIAPLLPESQGFTSDDKIQERVTLLNWDPTTLMKDLYAVNLVPDPEQSFAYINMEGYMEKLPTNKRKATLLKTWKRRYFQAKNGNLIYYESGENDADTTEHDRSGQAEKTGVVFTLVGGSVEDLTNGMLGLDDGRGRYLVVKPPTEREFKDWKRALESQTVGDHTAKYIRPVMKSAAHPKKRVVIIDLGSCSVRAGILGHTATLPQVFFPTVVSTDKETGKRVIGCEALTPRTRADSNISYPVRPSARMDKFLIDMEVMPDLFQKVFKDLTVEPSDYLVMLSAPGNLSDKMKEQMLDILIKQFRVTGVNIVNQALLALYSYGATSGIVVDIGERLEIVPITDGYIVEQGMTRQPYGGHKITEMLNSSLTERRYRFFTDVAFQLVRLGMEKLCYVSQSYEQEFKLYQKTPQQFKKSLDLSKYDLPEGTWTQICNDLGRFRSPEGLFNLEMWGMDNPPLQKLIQKAVQACPMDTRREMWRSIYLSGGVTQLPGFSERLYRELTKLVPGSITVQVHALPQRYHSAYIGACTLAAMNVFQNACISSEEWNKTGPPALRKWHLY